MLPPAELRLILIAMSRPGMPISDEVWEEWTGLDKRMKQMAIKGAMSKGLVVEWTGIGKKKKATFSFDSRQWESYYVARPRDERGRTAGRSKSVTPKPGQQIHQECRDRGCARMCDSQVIPFPATNVAKPVSRTEPPKNFPLTLEAIQSYFPHVQAEFVEKLRVAIIQRGVKQYTDAQIATAIHAARKDRRSQQTEGLFLHTVPERLAAVISTGAHLTEAQRREVKLARKYFADVAEGIQEPDDACERQAREILNKHGG